MSRVRFRLATINALGHSHTRPGGNKRGWLNSTVRTVLLTLVIVRRRFSIVGLQEFQPPQQRVFRGRMNLWRVHAIKDNAVVWLRARWKLVDQGSVVMPYFHGHPKAMPFVVLRRRSPRKRGRKLVAVLSIHNPASVHGDALAWREEGWHLEAKWAKTQLGRDDVDVVAAFTVGDRNSEAIFRHTIERLGGQPAGTPSIWGIDWIVGWGPVAFTRHKTSKTLRIEKATDHPVEQATAVI